jgi:hypothetical protein
VQHCTWPLLRSTQNRYSKFRGYGNRFITLMRICRFIKKNIKPRDKDDYQLPFDSSTRRPSRSLSPNRQLRHDARYRRLVSLQIFLSTTSQSPTCRTGNFVRRDACRLRYVWTDSPWSFSPLTAQPISSDPPSIPGPLDRQI